MRGLAGGLVVSQDAVTDQGRIAAAENGQPSGYRLNKGTVRSFRIGPGQILSCETGMIWLTQANESGDVILNAGEFYQSRSYGQIVVQAIEFSRIALD